MARAKKMATVTGNGSRLEQLENLAKVLAKQIDVCANGLGDKEQSSCRRLQNSTERQ